MKILLIDNAGLIHKENHFFCVEGTGRFAAELVELGTDVTMFGQKMDVVNTVSNFDIEVHGIKTAGLWRRRSKLLNYLRLYINAIQYIRGADFVYIFYPNSFRFLALICSLFRVKYGLYIRGDKNIDDIISRFIYKRAVVVLTVSQLFTNMVNQITGRSIADNIRPMLSYDDRDIVFEREYVRKEKYEILFLCRIQKEKGLFELMQALAQLKDMGRTSFHLTVAGDGDFLKEAKDECEKMGLQSDVSFLGGIYDDKIKADLYKSADIYILPTYYNEGFPRTLYEAMIFGTPILTTLVAGISALMKNNENCIELKPRSVDSIVGALSYALENYEDMGVLARTGTDMVARIVDRNRPTHAKQLLERIKDNGKYHLE